MNLTDRLAARDGTTQRAASEARSPATARHQDHPKERLVTVKLRVHGALLDALGPTLYDPNMSEAELELRVRSALQLAVDADEAPLSSTERNRIVSEVADEILGNGPLEVFLRDPKISEIMVNGADRIYVEREGRLSRVAATFIDEAHLRRTIDKIVARVGRRIDEASPMVDARLSDGSRVNAIIPPLSLDGSSLTIRKFAADPFTDRDLIGFGTLTQQTAEFLFACVRGKLSSRHISETTNAS